MKRIVWTLALAVTLAGCGNGSTFPAGDGGGGDGGGNGGGGTPTDFTALLKSLFDNTDDTSDPVSLDGLDLQSADFDDPTAFDDILGN